MRDLKSNCFGLLAVLALLPITLALGNIIPSNRTTPWIPGATVGVLSGIPMRTNLINVTLPPYNADKTGSNDAAAVIQAAINAAASNDVIYLPAGKYRLSSTLFLDRSYISLRGNGPTNTILFGLSPSTVLKVGHDV